MKRPKQPTVAIGITVMCFAVFFTVALVTVWWHWYGEPDWDAYIEDSGGGWKSGQTVITLIDSGKTMRVSGWGQMGDYGFVGCSFEYDHRPWEDVAPAITGLVIEEGVTTIGQLAFSGFSGLTSVTIPNSVFHIGDAAFANCTGLTTVTIPRSVVSCGLIHWGFVIGPAANVFRNCGSLMSVNVSKWNPAFSSIDGVLFDKAKKTLLLYPRGRQGAYTIPNGVTEIEDYAFEDCRGLTSVTIPNSVRKIEAYVFRGCTGLKSVTIPGSVTAIWNGTFYGCRSLTSVTIPKSVTDIAIGYDVFAGCDSLTSINIDSGNPAYAFADGALFNKAKDSLLLYLSGRRGAYTIPNGVAYINEFAFSGSTGLTSILAAEDNAGYSSIDGVLFNKDKTVLIQYPEGRQGDSYTIPGGVTGIKKSEPYLYRREKKGGAFYRCGNLKSVTVPGGLTEITADNFSFCDSLTSINVAADNAGYSSTDGVLFNKNKTALILYPRGRRQGAYTIPNGVAVIGDRAFQDCDNLTSVTIPNGITSIGKEAFYDCDGLTSVTIPNSVTSIDKEAFESCNRLTSVTVQNPKPPELGESVFMFIDNDAYLYVPKGSIDAYRAAGGWKYFECIKDMASARE
jgi:hypothetical protein